MALDHRRAAELGRIGGQRSGEARRRRLTPERVRAELGPLDSPEDAQRWLRTVVTWAASGLVPGTVAQACASLVREWLKANELALDRQQIRALEQRVRELEAELSQREREPLRAVP